MSKLEKECEQEKSLGDLEHLTCRLNTHLSCQDQAELAGTGSANACGVAGAIQAEFSHPDS
jgi:hypothetical protein